MKSYEKKSVGHISLKAKIKGFEAIAKSILKQARVVDGQRRANLKLKKNQVGYECRHHLAAYALMRGLPFSMVESKCKDGNYLRASKVMKILEEHSPYQRISIPNAMGGTTRLTKWTIEAVKDKLIRDDDYAKDNTTLEKKFGVT